jgi:hypothetical protein
MMSRGERQIAPWNGHRDRIPRPSVLENGELVITPGQDAEKAVDHGPGRAAGKAIGVEVNMDRLRVVLRLWHEDQTISIELNQRFTVRPGHLGIDAHVQEPRLRHDAECFLPRLARLFCVILRTVTGWRRRKRSVSTTLIQPGSAFRAVSDLVESPPN